MLIQASTCWLFVCLLGLSNCKWPGRYHQVTRDKATFYFDGAHTAESIELAFYWFLKQSDIERRELEAQGRQVQTALMFNKTGIFSLL